MKVNPRFFSKKYDSPLRAIYPLLKVCTIFAIVPPYAFGDKSRSCSRQFKFYAMFVLAVLLGGYLYHVFGKANDNAFETLSMTINLIDHFTMLTLTATSTAIILLVSIWHSEKFNAFLSCLENFDESINFVARSSKRKFWFIFSLAQIGIILTLIVDAITWVSALGMRVYKYYILRNVQWYKTSLALFLIFWLATEIKCRLRRVNVLLWHSVKGFHRGPLFTTQFDESDKPFLIRVVNYEVMKKIKNYHAVISGMVVQLNSLFGTVLLCAVLFNITNVVFYTQMVMVYVVFQNDGTFGPFIVVNSLMWIGAALLQTMLIAAACDGLTKEAKRLPEICYTLLNDVPSVPKSNHDAVVKEELLLIADQSASKNLYVSAAGFFDVNFGMMGFIVASITSYIIVTIQFISDE